MRLTPLWPELRRRLIPGAGFAAVAVFAVLAGRFWHPYYGFTKFVQLDEANAKSGIHEIRDHPVYAYPATNSYDGAAYVQIAFHPLLDSPELQNGVGNVPYRARRILGSALAWIFAAGSPSRIAGTYAALNLGVWLALAYLLWRVLPVADARSWFAWAGVLFSAGALHSVRLALTDLLAAALLTAAIALGERGRIRGAVGALAAAGLARETALGAVAGLWRGPWDNARAWTRNLGVAVAVALPLAAWMSYIRWRAGPADQGFGNFAWPLAGWIEKWPAMLAEYRQHPNFRWLTITTLLATIGLTVQAVFLLRRRRGENAWWRAGIASVALMAIVGTSVWEGHPGAVTRVVLPLGLAFSVLAVREHAGWAWLAGGGLTVFSGVLALWQVPVDPRELASGHYTHGVFVARVDSGWFGVEHLRRNAWAWTGDRGDLVIETAPRGSLPMLVRLKLGAMSPREVEVRAGATVLWHGIVNEKPAWIEIPSVPRERGRIELSIVSSVPPVRESEAPIARALGFAIHGVQL
ncbi:MAG TPA: hypothetical protein VM029_09925 [Opitutaceae bacterium]|nr:hypothetical protein [Opitutaceae bacterium]